MEDMVRKIMNENKEIVITMYPVIGEFFCEEMESSSYYLVFQKIDDSSWKYFIVDYNDDDNETRIVSDEDTYNIVKKFYDTEDNSAIYYNASVDYNEEFTF